MKLSPTGMLQNITSSTGTSICSDNLSIVRYNTIYGLVPYDGLEGCPPVPGRTSTYGGLLVTVAKEKSSNSATKTQIFFCRSGYIYFRQYWGSAYESWKEIPTVSKVSSLMQSALTNAFIPTGENILDSTVDSICSGDANNIPNNKIYGLTVSVDNITHLPIRPNGISAATYNGTIITFGKETARGYGDTQIYITNARGVYIRNYTGGSWNRWLQPLMYTPYKILGVGDSICEGWRNNNMGFVGELNIPYTNLGVTGATLGVKSNHAQIATQVDSLSSTDYGCVIADGGINDYAQNVPLGTVPTYPKTTSSEIQSLDKTTVCGGLEYLFYLIITKLPYAQRYFLITHKTNAYPSTQNSAGYTQQDLHDAIVAVCSVYNVEVIDVYKDSIINTRISYYKAPQAYSDLDTDGRAELTASYYVDKDGIHPLWLGYEEGYYPLIKRALLSATYKYS